MSVEAIEKKHIHDQAIHPVHVGRVADDCPCAGSLQQIVAECFTRRPCEDAAGPNVYEAGIISIIPERLTDLTRINSFEHGFHRPGGSMKGKIKNGGIPGIRVGPQKTIRFPSIVSKMF